MSLTHQREINKFIHHGEKLADPKVCSNRSSLMNLIRKLVWHLIYVSVWWVCRELETLSGGKQVWFLLRFGYTRCASELPTFPSPVSSPCKPFLSLPIFFLHYWTWEQKYLSEKYIFRKTLRKASSSKHTVLFAPKTFFPLCFDCLS